MLSRWRLAVHNDCLSILCKRDHTVIGTLLPVDRRKAGCAVRRALPQSRESRPSTVAFIGSSTLRVHTRHHRKDTPCHRLRQDKSTQGISGGEFRTERESVCVRTPSKA